ncbi:hypothetical protein HYG81_20595 (plasmid) [Natrinema zhouii]|uniref:hypothetical protein n=1 Tax=Natrinema zhouii TaxID=1710539 RepID=UPI001CFFF926|nr:hypothetical protein [Natrinema zhouii]UHQ98022.1 hypothetical protein HYG81_20595 [Natrinema zhouii]
MDEEPEEDRTIDPLGEISDENAFSELIEDLRDEGYSWNDIYEEFIQAFYYIEQPAREEVKTTEGDSNFAKIEATASVLRSWKQGLTTDDASPREKYIGDAFGEMANWVEESLPE